MSTSVSVLAPTQGIVNTQGLQTRDDLTALDPEAALEAQNLNRRQQIANLLIQQGIHPLQGQMAGRFYVPPSWAQGLAQLGQAGLGAYLNKSFGKEQADVAQKNQQAVAQALAEYRSQTEPTPAVAPSTVPEGSQGPSTPGTPAMERTPEQNRKALLNLMVHPQPQVRQIASALSTEQDKADARKQAVEMAMLQAKLKNQEPRVLSPGQTLLGGDNTPLASVAPNAVPINAGGTTALVNPQTGQPVGAPIPMTATPNAQLEDTRTRELFPQVSGNAAAAAAAQGGIALQAHQDRQAQMAQNQRQDDAMLELRKSQGLSDQEYKKERLALDQKHNDQTAQLAREKLAIDKQVHEGSKLQPGYRWTDSSHTAQEVIPGSGADIKVEGKRTQALAGLQSMTSDLDRLAVSANQILNHPGLPGITGLRGAVMDVPGTQAADARALLNKLKSQVGFSVLQNMRNNSKSGGALGNVSDNEGKRLENNLASVESAQSLDQMKSELKGIIDYVNGSKERLTQAYDQTYGEGKGASSATPGAPAPSTGPAKITSDADYNALPSGTVFIGPDGKQRKKP